VRETEEVELRRRYIWESERKRADVPPRMDEKMVLERAKAEEVFVLKRELDRAAVALRRQKCGEARLTSSRVPRGLRGLERRKRRSDNKG
jgi:hypothetical protein